MGGGGKVDPNPYLVLLNPFTENVNVKLSAFIEYEYEYEYRIFSMID